MTASSYYEPYSAHFARPNAARMWSSIESSDLQWLQVELLGVELVTSIETTGCGESWVQT